jgi:pilus assembly protein CpaF
MTEEPPAFVARPPFSFIGDPPKSAPAGVAGFVTERAVTDLAQASTVSQAASVARVGRAGGYPLEFAQLAPLVADPRVTDIFVNGPDNVWVDRGTGLERALGQQFSIDGGFDEGAIRALAVRLVDLAGRHVDETTPCVDARLSDGIRVHAVLPPVSPSGTLLSIRLPRIQRWKLGQFADQGFFSAGQEQLLNNLIGQRANLLISGAGGSGKTTLLSAILSEASPAERIVAIEDVAELRVDHPHFVSLESRQANLEGTGGIDLTRLVREALRMRPDRLVVGECRGAEIRDLLAALNTGHDGGAGTLHANSLSDVPARLEALGALAGMSPAAVARQAVSAIGMVLHLERKAGVRRLAQVGRLVLDPNDRLAIAVVSL